MCVHELVSLVCIDPPRTVCWLKVANFAKMFSLATLPSSLTTPSMMALPSVIPASVRINVVLPEPTNNIAVKGLRSTAVFGMKKGSGFVIFSRGGAPQCWLLQADIPVGPIISVHAFGRKYPVTLWTAALR
jgi:hypothetical protein